MYRALPPATAIIPSPVLQLKAVKNEVEAAGMAEAHIRWKLLFAEGNNWFDVQGRGCVV